MCRRRHIDSRLVAALARLDDGARPIADIHRKVGVIAETIGVPRPSYEQTRVVVHQLRRGRCDTSVGSVLLDIAFRTRPPEALLDVLE